MKHAKICRNNVDIIGEVSEGLTLDHECKDVKMYAFKVRVPRISGTIDEIPIMISSVVLDSVGISIEVGTKYKITGEYRSFNKINDPDNNGNNKLLLHVVVKDIEIYDTYFENEAENNNRIQIEGYVAKVFPVRKTTSGREIMDVILSVNRKGYKSSYIPCLIWFPTKHIQETITRGKEISIIGRIQSRNYIKRYDDETEEKKVAYEVSAQRVYLMEYKQRV